MRHGKLDRDQLVAMIGEVEAKRLEGTNCEPTSRCQTDGDTDHEWMANIRTLDLSNGEDVVASAYYYVDEKIWAGDDENWADNYDWHIHGYDVV